MLNMLWPKKGNLIQKVAQNLDELSQRQRNMLWIGNGHHYQLSCQCTPVYHFSNNLLFNVCVATSYSLCYERCGSLCRAEKKRLWKLGLHQLSEFYYLGLSSDVACAIVFNNLSRSQSPLHWTLCQVTEQSNRTYHSRKNRDGSNKGVKHKHSFMSL